MIVTTTGPGPAADSCAYTWLALTRVAAAIIIAARVEWLGVLAPIGRRAYSLYLWNWPMTVLFGSLDPIAPVVTILVAEVSYRLLEAPVMHRGPGQRVKATPTPKTMVDDAASA